MPPGLSTPATPPNLSGQPPSMPCRLLSTLNSALRGRLPLLQVMLVLMTGEVTAGTSTEHRHVPASVLSTLHVVTDFIVRVTLLSFPSETGKWRHTDDK